MKNVLLTASIVLYEEDLKVLSKTIHSFLSINASKKLFLIDNTSESKFKNCFDNQEIIYIENKKNIGFGSGHNKVLSRIPNFSHYHLILNPDVFFTSNTILTLINELKEDSSLAMIAPKVTFLDGTHQFSCRRYPKVLELIGRRSTLLKPLLKDILDMGEYKDKNLNEPFYCEYLTGCFQLYKTIDFVAINGFDERYFLYMEDVDICRKIDLLGKNKLYYPKVSIHHILKQGSLKKINLFIRHTSSAIKYFLKWGIH